MLMRHIDAHTLVLTELLAPVHVAIAQEKQIKAGSRREKLDLIAEQNPNWRDFGDDLALL